MKKGVVNHKVRADVNAAFHLQDAEYMQRLADGKQYSFDYRQIHICMGTCVAYGMCVGSIVLGNW